MHEYKRFIQEQMDRRGWRQADLVRTSGLSRALVSRILRDDRERLGQMPDESTMVGLAKAFGVSVETVRTAASRALRGYVDDGAALTADLSGVSIDALLEEVRRRVVNEDQSTTSTPSDPPANEAARTRGAPMRLVSDQHTQYALDQICGAVGIGFTGSKDREDWPAQDSDLMRSLVAGEFDRWAAGQPFRYIRDKERPRPVEYFREVDDGASHRRPLAAALGLPFGQRRDPDAPTEQLHAARGAPGRSKGETLHRQVEEAGEESQDNESEDPA